MNTLIGQFTRFAVQNDLETDDWGMVATEFDVKDTLRDIDRFHASWNHSDDDKQANTTQFLREVAEEDEEKAVGVMERIYTLADTDSETLEKYPALEVLENEEPGTEVLYSTFRSEQFLDIANVPGTFYPDLVEDINQCYSIGVNDATLVLTRKLLENLANRHPSKTARGTGDPPVLPSGQPPVSELQHTHRQLRGQPKRLPALVRRP